MQNLKRFAQIFFHVLAILMTAPAQADCGFYVGAGGQLICDTTTGQWRDNDVNLPIN